MAATIACAPPAPPDTRAQDEAAVREADAAFSAAAQSGDLDATMAFYADDAVSMPPNDSLKTGKAAIRQEFETMMALPGFSIGWQPSSVEVAASGDLAYSRGTAEFGMTLPGGAPMADSMKYVTIWRKQADGSWKVIVDIFNSNTPLPQPGE